MHAGGVSACIICVNLCMYIILGIKYMSSVASTVLHAVLATHSAILKHSEPLVVVCVIGDTVMSRPTKT